MGRPKRPAATGQEAVAQAQELVPDAGTAGRRILVVEDNPVNQMVAGGILEFLGYEHRIVDDGRAGVDAWAEGGWDAILMDVQMPVLDGISAAESIAGQRIAPVIVLTAFSQRELVERARDAGAMAYLVKPFSKSDLVPAIEMAVSRFAELAAVESEVADLKERLETRKVVDRAKGVLQEQLSLTEPEAFRWIQKTAMDLRLSMKQVAEGVISHGPGIAGPAE